MNELGKIAKNKKTGVTGLAISSLDILFIKILAIYFFSSGFVSPAFA